MWLCFYKFEKSTVSVRLNACLFFCMMSVDSEKISKDKQGFIESVIDRFARDPWVINKVIIIDFVKPWQCFVKRKCPVGKICRCVNYMNILAIASNKAHFCDYYPTTGHFNWGVNMENCYVNFHLHRIIRNLKIILKLFRFPPLENFLRTPVGRLMITAHTSTHVCRTPTSRTYCITATL